MSELQRALIDVAALRAEIGRYATARITSNVLATATTVDEPAEALARRPPLAPRQTICPECAGVDEEYWDRRTLSVAYQAGIDAGNTAWGTS
jgi:hypothetical protein